MMECPDLFLETVERWLEGAGRTAADVGAKESRAS
jgi:hypothetical protein